MSSLPEVASDCDRRRSFLALAHQTVNTVVQHDRLPAEIPVHGVFAERRGVFVTLHVRGKLRGCIGVIEAREPLGEAIVRAAASASLHDPRFSRLRKEELSDLAIEISVLSVLSPICPEDVEIGKHGLYVASGRHRGLLLPQVAMEHRLDREQFLDETCLKAGLPRDAWRRGGDVILFGFTCEIYADDPAVHPV